MYETLTRKIKKILNRRQELTLNDSKLIASWKEEYKIKDDIILEAVKRARDKKGEGAPLIYVNGILKNWYDNGVENYTDILKLDEEYKKAQKDKTIIKKNSKLLLRTKIKLLSDTAHIPTYGSEKAAGADLYADIKEDIFIDEGKTIMIPTGIALEIPDGYAGFILARSGLSSKRDLAPANKIGLIDSDYRGEIFVALHNHSLYDRTVSRQEYIEQHSIKPGEKIAQLVIMPYTPVDFVISNNLSNTERGEGGFGSTGRTE